MLDKLYSYLNSKNIQYDKELCIYGLSAIKDYLLFLIVISIPLVGFNLYLEFLNFLLLYIPLRENIGGLHFKKKNFCFLGSIILAIFVCFLISISFIPNSILVMSLIAFFLFLFIRKYGCMDCEAKKLNENQKNYHRKKTYHLIALYYILALVSFVIKIEIMYQTISCLFLFFLFSFIIFRLKTRFNF